MAQIPMGNAGRAVPSASVVMPNTGHAQAAAQLGRAVENLGQTLGQIGLSMHERRKQQELDAQDKADAAVTLEAYATGKTTLKERREALAQSIRLGEVKTTEAADQWKQQSMEFVEEWSRSVPESRRRGAKAYMLGHALEMGDGVREVVQAKTRDDTRAGLMSALEDAERDALRNRQGATDRALMLIQELGPYAGFGADDQQRLAQGFKEKTAFSVADAMVRSARDDHASLDQVLARVKSDEFADLSPERVAQLEQRVIGRKTYLQHQEQTRIARAEAAAARRAREAEQTLKAVQTIVDNGGMPDAGTLAMAQAKVAGTPLFPALTQLLRDSADHAAFAQLPPARQQAVLLEMRAKANAEGTNPRQEAIIQRRESIAQESAKQLTEDPLLYGVNRRLIGPVQPLAFNDVPTLLGGLAGRIEQAQTIGARVGRNVSPLLATEAHQLGEMLNVMPYQQREQALRTLAASLPDQGMARALALQVAPKDPALALAMFASGKRTPAGDSPSALLLRGQDAVKAGRVKDSDEPSNLARQEIARSMSEVPWPSTSARDASIDAAHRIWLGLRDQGNASARKAVEIATGGLTEWADKKTPLPYGMPEREFTRRMRAITPEALTAAAGAERFDVAGQALTAQALAKAMPEAVLVPVDDGVYALELGGAIVKANGRVFRLNVGR